MSKHILRLCTFKGLQNLPLYVAQRQGFLDAQGLEVQISYTSGSKPQLAGLARGEYDLVQTAPDNVINFDTAPAAFGIEPSTAPRIVMLLGGSVGTLSLFAQPEYKSIESLRGSILGVDNPGSGYALVLRDMLAHSGLLLNRDYTFRVAGGTSARLQALTSGECAATILYLPFDIQAAQQGMRRLATSTDFYLAYASLCTAALADWVEAHQEELLTYLIAICDALRWIYEPSHAQALQETMQQEPELALTPEVVERVYAAFSDPASGFGREARLDMQALQQVIDLRAQYSPSSVVFDRPEVYCDLRWYRRVFAG